MQHHPQASQEEEKKAESNLRNHELMLVQALNCTEYFNLKELLTGRWALRSLCVSGV